MTDKEIRFKVVEIVTDQLAIKGELADLLTADIRRDLKADSLDGSEILMRIEDAFKISIGDEEAADLRTTEQLIAKVLRKLSEKQG